MSQMTETSVDAQLNEAKQIFNKMMEKCLCLYVEIGMINNQLIQSLEKNAQYEKNIELLNLKILNMKI